ncbi:hypothetical protein B0T19DRAFT_437106 [Cercophora scortea]|uniref:Amidoligase enzyme-domain-containing protein n=1 Tax=Cercophora scortea TaxID=314031 RepID=A0AAE0J3Q5_9PEZI|nr:hypothetical protein B0T19DRAFT_437106 [Cercophora scortea]
MAPFIFDDGASEALDTTYNKPQVDTTARRLTNRVLEAEGIRSAPARTAGPSPDDTDPQLDTVDDLAFGFELKCLLPLLVKGNTDPEPDDKRRAIITQSQDDEEQRREQAYECLVDTIRDAGQNATTITALNKLGHEERQCWESSWIVKKANSAVPLEDEKALEGYVWVSIEVNSPKLRARDPETCRRVSAVLTALNSAHRLRANYSCEVHVHLGRMDGHPFSLSTLKRLATLLWLAEPILRSIRDPKSPNYNSVYTWGSELLAYSRLAKKLRTPVPAADAENDAPIQDEQLEKLLQDRKTAASVEDSRALHEIWRTSSHLDLGRLLSGDERRYRRLGFNFSAFGLEDERAKNNPRTLEFRIMEGMVQTDPILGWLFICSAIAEAAVLKSDDRLARAVERMLRERSSRIDRVQLAKSGEAPGVRLGRAFRDLMEDLEVPRAYYHGLGEKIVSEN